MSKTDGGGTIVIFPLAFPRIRALLFRSPFCPFSRLFSLRSEFIIVDLVGLFKGSWIMLDERIDKTLDNSVPFPSSAGHPRSSVLARSPGSFKIYGKLEKRTGRLFLALKKKNNNEGVTRKHSGRVCWLNGHGQPDSGTFVISLIRLQSFAGKKGEKKNGTGYGSVYLQSSFIIDRSAFRRVPRWFFIQNVSGSPWKVRHGYETIPAGTICTRR